MTEPVRVWQIPSFVCRLTLVALLAGWVTVAGAEPHPHLFFSAGDVPALRQRAVEAGTDPANFYANPLFETRMDARNTYGPTRTIPNSNRKRNAQAIQVHGAILLLDPNGLALDSQYQSNTLFFDYFNTVLNWPDWDNFFGNTPFDTTDFLIGLCIGYDWHYDRFTPAQRTDIVNKLAQRADYLVDHASTFFDIPADLTSSKYGYLHTFKVLRNRNIIPAAGLGVIAYTLEGEVSESRRQRWLGKVDEVLETWNTYVAQDGLSHEGYSYHEYMLKSLFPFLAIRSRRTGVNQFTRYAYIQKHPLTSIYAWVPGGDRSYSTPAPFGDCVSEPPNDMRTMAAMAASWLKGDPQRQDELANWIQWQPLNGPANLSYSRTGPLHFMLADPSIPMRSPMALKLPRFHYYQDRGGFFWRSGWDDMATWFGLMCGPTIGGHQQPEMGNFVIYKGGAPYIAHHGPTKKRRTEYQNVPMVNGQGQWGDRENDGDGTTAPQPSSRWARIDDLVADDAFFNVMTNLRPIYRDGDLRELTREYLGVGDYIFVRDRLRMNDGRQGDFDLYLHAYATDPLSTPPQDFEGLDIDSRPSVNPWGGGNGTWAITPRSSGPFTGSLAVRDLSGSAWSPSISPSVVTNNSNETVTRGYKLVRSLRAQSATSLIACTFPPPGETLSAWPDPSAGEGFVVRSGDAVRALALWPAQTGNVQSNGLNLNGAMGGLMPGAACWGRDLTLLEYQGRRLVQASAPVSFYVHWGSAQEAPRLRFTARNAATCTLDFPIQPKAIRNGTVPMNPADWSWNNGTLTLNLPAQPGGTEESATLWFDVGSGVAPGDWDAYR